MRSPNDTIQHLKRVVGLPGEQVQLTRGDLFINDTLIDEPYIIGPINIVNDGPITLGPDQYYVLGDNRMQSLDSSEYGPITQDQLLTRIFLHFDRDAPALLHKLRRLNNLGTDH